MNGLLIAAVVAGLPKWASAGAGLDFTKPEQKAFLPDWFQVIMDVNITPNGAIWVLGDGVLYGFDTEGNVFKEGLPLTFLLPSALAYNEKSQLLGVLDIDGLHLLDVTGKAISQVDLFGSGIANAKFMAPYDKGFVVVGYDEKAGKVFHVFNEKGEFQKSFGDPVQDPQVVQLSPTMLVPLGVSASDKWLIAVDPYSYDLLVYEKEQLKRRLSLPIPDNQLMSLVPKVITMVKSDGGINTALSVQTSIKTAILGDAAMVVVTPPSGQSWLWAVDLKEGKVLNSMCVDLLEQNLRFIAIDPDGTPLFWNKDGIYRIKG